MIASVKVNKLNSVRGNTVGIVRTNEFVFAFTFKETQPSYHMLTVSAQRIKQLNQSHDSVASSGRSRSSNISLSTSLSTFDLFANYTTRIQLLPITRSDESSKDAAIEGSGFYTGSGFASYLVSKHTLQVRIMPKRKYLLQIEKEREIEMKRRQRIERRRRKAAETLTSDVNEETCHDEDDADDWLDENDSENEPIQSASLKRKSTDSSTSSDTPSKKSRIAASTDSGSSPRARLDDAAVGVGDIDSVGEHDSVEIARELGEIEGLTEDESEWLSHGH